MLDEAAIRQQKLEAMRADGVDPYPASSHRTAMVGDVQAQFDVWMKEEREVVLCGRLMTVRVHGGLMFADLKDASGRLQLFVKKDVVGDAAFDQFRDRMDPADMVEVRGVPFLTQRGERSLKVVAWKPLVKALLPLPDKWHGLQDVEQRFRKRYLDLLMSDDVTARMVARSKVISAMRAHLDGEGFIEVETPTLQPIYGGGFAKPFKTRHNALEADFYLRISDEMYLKRLLVGGFEKVYEITKVFRNEGIDRDHNPEFTMFEAQVAYEDYRYGMDLFEALVEKASLKATGTTEIVHGDVTVSVARPWKRMRLVEAVKEIGGVDPEAWTSAEDAKKAIRDRIPERKRADLERMETLGEIVAFAFEELVEEQLIQPTIIYDYPVEVSPLAKKAADHRFVERFEVFALGSEIGNNYSELNDPTDLERRFIAEKKKEAAGFDEAHQTDEDYLEAIRHGLPPACGLGIGIDRLVMLLTGAANIKEVILFPTLRPER
jgi:lysyl-tRNA synthetase class 2